METPRAVPVDAMEWEALQRVRARLRGLERLTHSKEGRGQLRTILHTWLTENAERAKTDPDAAAANDKVRRLMGLARLGVPGARQLRGVLLEDLKEIEDKLRETPEMALAGAM